MLFKIIYSLFVVFFWSSICFAQPIIKCQSQPPTINDGTEFSFKGKGFLGKDNPFPVKWENFNSNTTGSDIESSGFWTKHRAEDSGHIVTNSVRRYGSAENKCAQFHYVGDGLSGWASTPPILSGRAYLNFWVRLRFVKDLDVSKNPQHKLWSLAAGTGHSSYPLFMNNMFVDSATMDAQWQDIFFLQRCGISGCGNSANFSKLYNAKEDTWYNITLMYQDSGVDTANSKIIISKSDPNGLLKYHTIDFGNKITRTQDNTSFVSTLNIGYLMVNNQEVITWFDDIYIDNTWARVEIGDKQDYDSCTHREIQYPTLWTRIDNSSPDDEQQKITITVNQGSMPSGTSYLFVVDKEGTPSVGCPVIFQ